MLKDFFTTEATIALLSSLLGLALGFVLSFIDHMESYNEGWHQGVEDVIAIINLWEEEI